MKFFKKVADLIGECVSDYIVEHKDSFVLVEISEKNGEIGSKKAFLTESAASYLEENKYKPLGLKSFVKEGRVNKKFCYIIFESFRLDSSLHAIETDLKNIEIDAINKIKG